MLYPDPRLTTPCAPIETITNAVRELARDLIETMDAAPPRTVGIAAPQVGECVRMAIVDTSRNPKYAPGHGLLVLINPVIEARAGEQTFREGCLSLPDYTANIRRSQTVTVRAQTLSGDSQSLTVTDFEAVVMQHELDHLDGILFLDRVTNVKTDLFRRGAHPPRPPRAE